MPKSGRTTADVDLAAEIFPDFPAGWRSPLGIMEGFLLTGALEMQARSRLDRYDPFGDHVLGRLPKKFQGDGLGALIAMGPSHPDEWNRSAQSSDPEVNYLLSRRLIYSGEKIGRLVLLGLVWRFADEAFATTSHLGSQDRRSGYFQALRTLQGTVLNAYGTTIFAAVFESMWFSDTEPRQLSTIEQMFLDGETIGVPPAQLNPGGTLYLDSIWALVFRLIERRTPEHYVSLHGEKVDTVEYIISKRPADEAAGFTSGGRYRWSGWPHQAADYAPPPSPIIGVENLNFGQFVDDAGFTHEPHWVEEATYWMSGVYVISVCCTCGKRFRHDGDPSLVRTSMAREFQHPGLHEVSTYETRHEVCADKPEHQLFPVTG